MTLDHGDDVRWGEARKGRLCEVRVFGDKVFWTRMDVREVAPAASGDEDLFPGALCMFQEHHSPSAPSRFEGADHSGRSGSKDDDINFLCGHSLIHS
jgi:hypothetical protein